MCYDIEVIRKDKHKTSVWSGGTTTELYIYPKDSLYCNGNFKWRLSSAKVEVEKSTFTHLPDIARVIMVIEGELFLKHEGHHNAKLKAFEQDSFSGSWSTTSFGKVVDFNLMMAQDCKGYLESISINTAEFKDILLHRNKKYVEKFLEVTEAFYIVNGNVEIDVGEKEQIQLNEGDLALINTIEKDYEVWLKISNCVLEEVKIIRASIFS